jgi:hypothetical protein
MVSDVYLLYFHSMIEVYQKYSLAELIQEIISLKNDNTLLKTELVSILNQRVPPIPEQRVPLFLLTFLKAKVTKLC